MKIVLSKNVFFFLPEIRIYLSQNTFIHCSRIPVAHIHVNSLSKIRLAFHLDANLDVTKNDL